MGVEGAPGDKGNIDLPDRGDGVGNVLALDIRGGTVDPAVVSTGPTV
jgi:hypothetical protein